MVCTCNVNLSGNFIATLKFCIVQLALLIRGMVGFVIKCVPRDNSYNQRILIHNLCVETNFGYSNK